MPSKKSKSVPLADPFPLLETPDPPTLIDHDSEGRSAKKKKNGTNKQIQNISIGQDWPPSEDEITQDEPLSPLGRPSSLLSQIPFRFAETQKSKAVAIPENVSQTEKVSDQYTPPSEPSLPSRLSGKGPTQHALPTAIHGPDNTPPTIEPGFNTKLGYAFRSPPSSPPHGNTRPLSFTSGLTSMPGQSRSTPTAQGYTGGAFGSPPAPHLPQQHFYAARDVDLGLTHNMNHNRGEEPSLIKFANLPSARGFPRHGLLVGSTGSLALHAYDGDTVEKLDVVTNLSGTVVDATFLTWTSECDPFADLRPLLAIAVHGDATQRGESATTGIVEPAQMPLQYSTSVEIHSLSKRLRVTRLLETQSRPVQPHHRHPGFQPPPPIGALKLKASGNFLVVSSGVSGEVLVFSASTTESQPTFECLAKLWTEIQPRIQHHDSSGHRLSDTEISPADLGRGSSSTEIAMLDISGRWLATCPASTPSRSSVMASIGEDVRVGRNAGVEAATAPVRPTASCTVESPDVDTLLGKVARGVAQEMVKGAKWLGDQGIQAWQSYWRRDQTPPTLASRPAYSPPNQPYSLAAGPFPPTHAEGSPRPRDVELVSVLDLKALAESAGKKSIAAAIVATFQPPRGCSFLSFAPNGLSLLSASRKGDFHYVWDLLQVQYPRTRIIPSDQESTRWQPCVRQIARFERMSDSTIVDIAWDTPVGARFAVFTKNKTVHLYDLPVSAFAWPPPRMPQKHRRTSVPAEDLLGPSPAPPPGSFLASAISIAGKTQPMLANWRGRAPSVSGGLAGIGTTGLGFASATGARGGKAVAAGLSKSLGAASDTVSSIRHAGEGRIHLKSMREALSGRVVWESRRGKPGLTMIDGQGLQFFAVRHAQSAENRARTNASVFEARKSFNIKLAPIVENGWGTEHEDKGQAWMVNKTPSFKSKVKAHPLSFAEIETNSPYQPFHSDRRVSLYVYPEDTEADSLNPLTSKTSRERALRQPKSDWVFGEDIPAVKLNLNSIRLSDEEDDQQGSVIYRETTISHANDAEGEQIVSTTRRRKTKKGSATTATVETPSTQAEVEQEGFFEDDCDVLDFATDRV